MIKRILIIIFILVLQINFAFCEQKYSRLAIYDILALPEEKIDLALVKLSIDKEIDPNIDIDYYMASIDKMVSEINKLLPQNPTSRDKLGTLKKYLYESGAWNNYRPFAYDLDDPLGHNIKNQLLSTYIETRKGNCVSMPSLFLILGKRIGMKVFLSEVPQHYLVQYVDDTGRTLNIETTNGGSINRDIFYVEETGITDKAIANELFLVPLTNKESALSMFMILNVYYLEIGDFNQELQVCDLVLRYRPNDVYALARKGSVYSKMLDKQLVEKGYTKENIKSKLTKADKRYLDHLYKQHLYWFSKAEELGWKDESPQRRENYLKSIQAEKEYQKQQQSHLYYMRYSDPYPARFMGRDKIKIEDDPKAYYQINPYQYANNNPVKNIDPDGRYTVIVHGTFSHASSFDKDFIKSVESTFKETSVPYEWGFWNNSRQARISSAEGLANKINSHPFAPGEKLNIIAHSHGGNVVKELSNMELNKSIDTAVLLGTPQRSDHQMNYGAMSPGGKVYNFYSNNDRVQPIGGRTNGPIGPVEVGYAGRTMQGAINKNIDATHTKEGAIWGALWGSETRGLTTKTTWEREVAPNVK